MKAGPGEVIATGAQVEPPSVDFISAGVMLAASRLSPTTTRAGWFATVENTGDEPVLARAPRNAPELRDVAAIRVAFTASHFATDFYPVQAGDYALIHAAAGGVGGLLTQIVKLRGGHVIGRVSTESKVGPAREAGCDHVIVDAGDGFADPVLELTGGEGVNVVYDGSGPETFTASLTSLRSCGTFCWYGPALGSAMAVRLMELPKSIKIGYARFADHVHTPELLKTHARRLFDWILEGKLSIIIGGTYKLSEASQAQAALDARLTTGKLLLTCE